MKHALFNERQKRVLQNYADIKFKGNLNRAIKALIASGFKFEGYIAGGQNSVTVMTVADHTKLLQAKIESG